MATEVVPPPTATPADERVRRRGVFTRLFIRPEIGALIGAIVVWVFFAVVAHENNFISWAVTSSILNRAAPESGRPSPRPSPASGREGKIF